MGGPTNGFVFRSRRKRPRVETEMMFRAEQKTLNVHDFGGLVVWSGRSRIGKTTTALWMQERINGAFTDDDSNAFRCAHYQVGGVADQKKALRSLFHGTIGRLDEGLYRSLPPEDLAGLLVHALHRKRIEVVMVDEAGLLSIDAIRGMVLARDVAKQEGHRLSVVFIGMDDLPAKIEVVPQVANRVQEWVAFRKYNPQEVLRLLRELHPPYGDVTLEEPEVRAQIDFLTENYGALPGLIVPFVYRLDMSGRGAGDRLPTIKEFRAAHLIFMTDRDTVHDEGNRHTRGERNQAGKTASRPKRPLRKTDPPDRGADGGDESKEAA